MKASKPTYRLGQKLNGNIIVSIDNMDNDKSVVVVRPLSTYPTYKFKVIIKSTDLTKMAGYTGIPQPIFYKEYYAVGKAKNGETIFTWENRKSKAGLIKTVKNIFGEGITIVDKTK